MDSQPDLLNRKEPGHIQDRSVIDSDLSIVDMVQVFLQYKFVAILTFLVVLAVGVSYAYLATPLYRAEITLGPARSTSTSGLASLMSQFSGSIGSIAGLAGSGFGASVGARGEALTSLMSTAHIQTFIESKNLLPILFSDLWDPEKQEWIVESDTDIPTLSDGYDLMMENLTATEDPVTGIVKLSILWKDPVLAAEWANELVGTLNSRLRERAIKQADQTIDYLNQELERTKVVELRQAVFFMIEQKIGDKTNARVQQEYAFRIVNPAIAPDIDKFESPNRKLIIAVALIVGSIAAFVSTFFAYAFSQIRAEFKKKSAINKK